REPEVVEGLTRERRNPIYLRDLECPVGLKASTDHAEALDGAEMVLLVVPSEFFAATLKDLPPIEPAVPVVSATKGLDPQRHVRMTELVAERFPQSPIAALSGPTFAREVALGQPTACVIASRDEVLARRLQGWLGSREFRLYTNRDVIGVEVGGALKNV